MNSIIIGSHNRIDLFRRTLWNLNQTLPSHDFEVVVVDDGSTDDILGLLKEFSSQFIWKFIRLDVDKFEKETGVKKFFNNPGWSYNVGFANCSPNSTDIFLHGNECLPLKHTYWQLLDTGHGTKQENYLCLPTSFNVPRSVLDELDDYGTNLNHNHLKECWKWPLQTIYYHADCINHIGLISRKLWEKVGGFDERYLRGIGGEDSDFVRRCRAIPGWTDANNLRRTEAVALHQYHGGRTMYHPPRADIITEDRWTEGEKRRNEIYNNWDGSFYNGQEWPIGQLGIGEVITNA